MSKLKQQSTSRSVSLALWVWFLPALTLAPLAVAAGCTNSGVVGDDCPTAQDCVNGGSAGKSNSNTAGKDSGSSAGKGNGNTAGKDSGCGGGSDSECLPGSGGGAPGDATCGGLLGTQCAADEFCLFMPTAACGAADQTGICTPKPQACDDILAPVCGCDGQTYATDCVAARAGVSVAQTGECSEGATCGGRGGATCSASQYCSYPPGADCGRADGTGTCTEIPMNVGCLANYDPVCGCDGKSYGNECEAQRRGVSIDHTGECGAPTTCGGLDGSTCASGSFCDYPPDMQCGQADGPGTCKGVPDNCPANVALVCGCDGKSYSNTCVANGHGISVAHDGGCP